MWELTEIEGINFGIYPGDVFYFDMEEIKQNTCVVKKEENGCEDITYTTGEIGDKLKITYVGFEAVGFQKAEMVFFAEPIFDVPLFGARGVKNSRNILDKIARLFLVPGMLYARSIRLEDYINIRIPGGKLAIDETKKYIYKKGDCSPQSFILGMPEIEGKTEVDTSAFLTFVNILEEEKNIFTPKEHWLATNFCQVSENYAEFGVGCAEHHIVVCNNNCEALFNTKGEEKGFSMPIRPVLYIDSRFLLNYLDIDESPTKKMEICAEILGVGQIIRLDYLPA